MNNLNKGFTMIELIVSVAIIAVLTVVSLVSYGGINKRARDSRRMSDLQKMAIGLEMAKQVGGTYPPADGANQPSSLVPSFMQSIPTDPKGYSYYYITPTNYTYDLYAYVEDLGSTTGSYGNNCGAVCNYKITNP